MASASVQAMPSIAVLGGGAVGSFIVSHLAEAGHRVRLLEGSAAARQTNRARSPGIEAEAFDATDSTAYGPALAGCDLAVLALPGRLGHRALRTVIEAGVDCVDISFSPEEGRVLDPMARELGVTAVVDCGVAPGLSNLLAAQLVAEAGEAGDRVERLEIFVGGLPLRRDPPWEYGAPFAVEDVLEEYTRPARVKQNGSVVEVPALSGPRPLEVEGVGTLEAFLTDGLRSLLDFPVPEMAEYTLRYPGHAAKVELLRDGGFFSTRSIKIAGKQIRPRELTLELLAEQWRLEPCEPEFTHLRIEAMTRNGELRGWLVHDTGPDKKGWTSMARTTGLTAAAFAELVLEGVVAEAGVRSPEAFGGEAALVERILGGLRAEGVQITDSR